MISKLTNHDLLLRIAIAFAFLYPAIDGFIEPGAWLGYFPPFLLTIVSGSVLLPLWGIVEIIIALWILSGKHIFLPSLAATLALLAIVVLNVPFMQIVFRDLALALVALTLTLHNCHRAQKA